MASVKFAFAGFVLLISLSGTSAPRESDVAREVAKKMWPGSQVEHRLPDGSRVDILTSDHAWEVEWADKWQEAIGQAVFYALATNRSPGIVLLLRGRHQTHWLRCLLVCRRLGIDLVSWHVANARPVITR